MHAKILILDFGSQFTQLIARRTRELGVYSEIQPYDYDIQKIKNDPLIKAIIFSGGPNSVYDQDSPSVDESIYELGIPILGTCYGLQLMGKKFGGLVEKAPSREYGRAEIKVVKNSSLTHNIPAKADVWMSHGDHLTTLPEGFQLLISSDNCEFSAIGNSSKKIYGVQFHPEVYHSGEVGKQILANFLFQISQVKSDWNSGSFIEEKCLQIKHQVGDSKVICGLSGGVDSAVVAAILHKSVANQVHCVFVDTGLMRFNEKEEVEKAFRDNFKISLTVVDASSFFLNRLKGVIDPETKRKIIGKAFIDVFEIAKNFTEQEILISQDMSIQIIKS
jgi:GMP synthase (glutamine-hydrolysing)